MVQGQIYGNPKVKNPFTGKMLQKMKIFHRNFMEIPFFWLIPFRAKFKKTDPP